ncbi:MAG TPA: hypothetical protein VHC90_25620 [Bryobacteraceae bacterium]|nr:hypothetical protein [Bryobacteraceae bacterium]
MRFSPIFPRLFSLALVVGALPPPRLAAADPKWVHASSAHFEIYGTQSETEIRAALQYLETVRAFFVNATHSQDPGGQPVRVVAFQSESDFTKYRPSEYGTVTAYSLAGPPATIVSAGLKPENYEKIFREYCQLVLDQSAPKIPYWLRAGLAQFYSTLTPAEGKIKLGAAPARAFHSHDGLDVDLIQLFGSDRRAFLESRSHSSAEFYADTGNYAALGKKGAAATQAMNALETQAAVDLELPSWALTHMIMFSSLYRTKAGEFIGLLSNGQDTIATFGSVWGRSIVEVRSDLNQYMRQSGLAVVTAPFKYDKIPAPTMKPSAKVDVEALLAPSAK